MSWKLVSTSSTQEKHDANLLFDENLKTYWQSQMKGENQFVILDLGKKIDIKSFAYTPPTSTADGMIQKGTIFSSDDGENWTKQDTFTFGNVINDPTQRMHKFKQSFINIVIILIGYLLSSFIVKRNPICMANVLSCIFFVCED